jgi:hypothetical protein
MLILNMVGERQQIRVNISDGRKNEIARFC